MNAGKKVGVFCSDVSGAFDKVSQELLDRKLRAVGVPDNIVALIKSWMEARTANVLVD